MCEFIVKQFHGRKKRSLFFVRSFCWEKISQNETNKKLIFFNFTELNFTVEEIEQHFWEYFFAFMLTVIMRWIGILLLWFQMNYIIPKGYLIFAFFFKKKKNITKRKREWKEKNTSFSLYKKQLYKKHEAHITQKVLKN